MRINDSENDKQKHCANDNGRLTALKKSRHGWHLLLLTGSEWLKNPLLWIAIEKGRFIDFNLFPLTLS
jgi:hypothetical protein